MPSVPDAIGDQEELGRAVFDSKHAKRAQKGTITPNVFQEKLGVRELSVDRLSYVNLKGAAEVQKALRGRECRGWAVLNVAAASQSGRKVFPDPILPLQPHHAYICLPEFTEEEAFNVQKTHALELAMNALWREAPSA
jgi:hypothetical protein